MGDMGLAQDENAVDFDGDGRVLRGARRPATVMSQTAIPSGQANMIPADIGRVR